MLRWLSAVGLAVAVLVAPAAAGAAPAGGVGVRVDGSPGSALDGGFIRLTASPGGSARGHFVITNTSQQPYQLSVYPADGLTGATTGVVYGDAGDELGGAGAWVTPSVRSANLSPGSEQPVDFSVAVPAGAGAGDHVASVVLEQLHPAGGDSAIVQVIRNVVPILVLVPGDAQPQVSVRSATISALPGSSLSAVTVSLVNTGAKMCSPSLTVELSGGSGPPEVVTRQLDTLLPGDRAPYPLAWSHAIEPGKYLVHASVAGCGTERSFSITAVAPPPKTNTGDAVAVKRPRPTVDTSSAPGVPRYEAGGGAPVLADGGSGKKHHRRHQQAASPVPAAPLATPSIPQAAAQVGTLQGSSSWLTKARRAVVRNAGAVAERAAIPLLLVVLIGLVVLVQEAIDRRDPKLALAPMYRDPHLAFEPNPLHTGGVIPLLSPPSGGL